MEEDDDDDVSPEEAAHMQNEEIEAKLANITDAKEAKRLKRCSTEDLPPPPPPPGGPGKLAADSAQLLVCLITHRDGRVVAVRVGYYGTGSQRSRHGNGRSHMSRTSSRRRGIRSRASRRWSSASSSLSGRT